MPEMHKENMVRTGKGISRLEIEVTRLCPLRCIHCSVSAGKDVSSGELTMREIKKVISEFSKLGGNELTITGGEPLARGEDFVLELLNEAEKRGLSSSIYTSGCLMDESFCKKLKGKSVIVCISIEGTEVTHDAITGVKNSYRRAVDALKRCQTNNIRSVINFTPMHINYREFSHVLEKAKELNAKSLKVFNFSAQGRGYDNRRNLKLSAKEQQESTEMIRKVLDEKEIHIDFGGEILGLNTRCSLGQKIVITCDGDVVPCLGLRSNSAFIIGNFRKERLPDLLAKLEKIRSEICLCSSSRTRGLSSSEE